MTSVTAKTGRNGKFKVDSTQIARTTDWSVNPTLASSSEWGDSEGGGYTNRAPGRKDATFDANGKYDTGTEVFDIFQPEDFANGVLFLDSAAVLYWDFPRAMCTNFTLSVNIDTEDVIGWGSSWGADGIFYYPGMAGAAARTY